MGAPKVDIAIPVFDEERVLRSSIRTLHAHCAANLDGAWLLTIADSASTDDTLAVAHDLATELDRIRVVHVDASGRGRALRAAWSSSTAPILAYMDVDLSTALDALRPLLDEVASGRSAIATGSRLIPGSTVDRRRTREVLSRAYNVLLRIALAPSFHDAQCGFKAIRADVAARVLPEVVDESWFFDTELLVRAERHGLRVAELPVSWVDDSDSKVKLIRTCFEDLRGIVRLRRDLGPRTQAQEVEGSSSAPPISK